jgi:uncharacterized protein (TIRG00374 family)
MKKLQSILKILIPLCLGIGLIYWFWNSMPQHDRDETISAFKRANYFWVLMAPAVGFLSNFIRTQRWRLMLKPIGYYPGYWNTFFAVMIMYFFNLFVPRLGEVSRCTVLAEYEKVPVEKSVGTMVTERLIDVLCLGIVFMLIVIFLGKDNFIALYTNFKNLTADIKVSGTLTLILKYAVPVLLIVGIGAYFIYYIRKNGVNKLKQLIRSKIKSLFTSILSVKDIEDKAQFVALTVAMWMTYLVMFYVNYMALPESTHLPIISALVCLFFGSLAVVLTPGGIGIFPIIVQAILISFNVAPSVALAIGMIAWAVQTLGMLIGGMASLILLNLLNKKEDAAKLVYEENNF